MAAVGQIAPAANAARLRRIVVEVVCLAAAVGLVVAAARTDGAWTDRHFLPEFRTGHGELLAGIAIARIAAVVLAAALALWIRPWLGRQAEQRSFAAMLAAAAPTALAVVLAVGATELILRATLGQLQARRFETEEPLRRRDARIGWVVIENRVGYDTGDRNIEYAIDPLGFRVARPGQAVDPKRPAVVFTGESIMMGQRLPWAQTTAALVAGQTGLQAADIAFSGYASDQAYLRLADALGQLAQPRAVVSVFLPSALYRILEPDRPHLDADLRWRPRPSEWRLAYVLRRQFPYHSEAEIEAGVLTTRSVLRATAALARRRGAIPLVVVPILEPESPQERAVRRRVLDDGGVPYLAVPIAPDWRVPGDRHPDARGARAMADAIVTALKRR
jgi:hypothetical protein